MWRALRWVAGLFGALGLVVIASVAAGLAAEGFDEFWYWHDFNWEVAAIVGTALGTTLLAIATLYLALGTRTLARTARLQVAVEQNALASTFRPLLLHVPFWMELPEGLGFYPAMGESDFVQVRAQGAAPDQQHEISLPVRNVGVGVAFVTGVFVEWKGERHEGRARNGILPPNEMTGLWVTRPYDGDLDSPGEERAFVMEVVYDDLGGNPWQTRITVGWRDAGRWQTRSLDHRAVGAPDDQAVRSGDMREW